MDTPPFSELGLPAPLLAAIETLGYERPSPIQAMSIPPALEGRDLVGLSATGSGKTAAFALPALAKLDVKNPVTQVLIICPTRELAVQVCEEVHRLGAKMRGLHATPVYGGAPMDRQLRALRDGAQVVVGTPGRLLDHLRRGSFDPSHIRMAILDEADRMLDMGFKEEMDELLGSLPPERQTLFFSATMNPGVSRLIKSFGKEPEIIEIQQKARTVSTVEQSYFEVRQRSKVEVLSRILDMNPPRLGIIFCNTKRSVDECTEDLVNRAVSFVYGRDIYRLQSIERYTRQVIKRERIPSVEQVEGRRADLIFDTLKERLESGKFDTYQDNIDRLLEQGHTPTDIAGALATMLRESSGREGEHIAEDHEPEKPARKEKSREARPQQEGRDARDERGPKPKFERGPVPQEQGMTRLFLSLGKTHGVLPKDIVGMMYREAGLPDGSLGRITLFPRHTLVDVPENFADQAIRATRSSKLRGQPFRIGVDRGPA